MHARINESRTYIQYLLTLVLLVISALLVYTQAAKKLDLLAYDAALHLSPAPVNEQIVIISIDEKSLNGIGQWPWRRAIHAQLIDKLTDYNVSLIAFDVLFSERSTTYPEDDRTLARAIRNNSNVLLPLHIHPLSYGNTLSEILPIPELIAAAKGLGHVHVELDEDGLARGLYLNSGVGTDHWRSLSMAMATEINPMLQYTQSNRGAELAPYIAVNTDYRLIPFAGPAGTYKNYSYLDVLTDRVPSEVFRDKIVLVGATAAGLGDIIPTPMSRLTGAMSGVELHANAYNAIMTRSAVRPVADIWTYLLTFAFIMIPILVFPRLKPTHVMPSTIVLAALVMLFSYLLMKYDRSWFPPINSVIGILIAYPLWSWQRMHHLNQFLSDELERMNKQPVLGFRQLSQHPAEKVFLSLLALLKPSFYVLKKNGQALHSYGTENLKELEIKHADDWQHSATSSWLELHQEESIYQIGLGWKEKQKPENTNEFLNKLDFQTQAQAEHKRHYEQIANRIDQVREAISAMQDMRTFISKGFEEMPGAVLVTDPVGIVVYCNSFAQKWFNKTEQEIINQSVYSLFQDDCSSPDAVQESISKVLLNGEQATSETALYERDVLIHCLPFLVDEDSDAGLMMTMSDISMIQQQQREKNQLIDFLSHDVRSPLVSQLAMLEGLRTGRIMWHAGLVDEIGNHAQRSLNLSEQFLQITRAEQSSDSNFYEFDFLATIENSIDSLTQQANAKHISISLKEEDEAWLLGNAELMERAITNLLSNAIKYSRPDTRITISLKRKDNRVLISISDQGLGISEEELPHIFNRFRRQKQSEVSGEKGAGLGLNFVKVVVDKHKGNIHVDSILGQGTTFTLDFPALED